MSRNGYLIFIRTRNRDELLSQVRWTETLHHGREAMARGTYPPTTRRT